MALSRDTGVDIEKLIRPDLAKLHAYTPIEPTEVLGEQAGIPPECVIKLDGNENPYGCSPRVQRALAACNSYHIYPDPVQRELRQALEEYTGIGREYIVAGSGSDDPIDLICRLFLEPGDRVINCVPTFGMYKFSTEVAGGQIVEVRRDANYNVDIGAVKMTIDSRTKLVFIASPNNPTGKITPEEDILELLETGLVVVIDEAYHEFCGVSVASLVPKHDNLCVLRTFSKWAGLAGLRVGYGLFPTKIAAHLQKIKQPYNVNAAGVVAAKESLADLDYLRGNIKAIVDERERLYGLLQKLSFLKPWPSDANFILCSVLRGEAKDTQTKLKRRGIFVRYFDTPLLRNFIRISVGKPEHTDAVIKALEEIGENL